MILAEATDTRVRHDWSAREVRRVHDLPITELVFRAQGVNRQFHDPAKVQLCTLPSIKTGGCPEDCDYCRQSAHYATAVSKEKLMRHGPVLEAAAAAKAQGSTRFCSGAAWRNVRDEAEFDQPTSRIRLSAGRREMSDAVQALGFIGGANSIHTGDKLLTAPTHEHAVELRLLTRLGMQRLEGYTRESAVSGPARAKGFPERGVLLRPLANVIYFLPRYIIDDKTVHGVFDKICEVVSRFTS